MILLLWVLWVIFNGKCTVEIGVIGMLICVGLYTLMVKYMGYDYKKEVHLYRKLPLYIQYAFILVWEVFKSNMAVMRVILSPKLEANPGFYRFHVPLKSEVSRVTLANSMTLTPGTYTVSLNENEYVIHTLHMDWVEHMEDSIFVKQLKKLEE